MSTSSTAAAAEAANADDVAHDVQYYIDQGYSRVRAIKLFYENSKKETAASVPAQSSHTAVDADAADKEKVKPKVQVEGSVKEKIKLLREQSVSNSGTKKFIDSEIDLSSPSRPTLRVDRLVSERQKNLYGNSKSSSNNLLNAVDQQETRSNGLSFDFQSVDCGDQQQPEQQQMLQPGAAEKQMNRITSDMTALDLRPLSTLHPSRFNSDYSLALTEGSDIDLEDSQIVEDFLQGESMERSPKEQQETRNSPLEGGAQSVEGSVQMSSRRRIRPAYRKPINYDEYLSRQHTLSLEERADILRAGFDSPAPISGVPSRDGLHSSVKMKNSSLTVRGKLLAESGEADLDKEELRRRGLLSQEQLEELTFSEIAVAVVSEATQSRLATAEKERQRQVEEVEEENRTGMLCGDSGKESPLAVEHQNSYGSDIQQVSTEDIDGSRSMENNIGEYSRSFESPERNSRSFAESEKNQQQRPKKKRPSDAAMEEASQFYEEVQSLISKGYTRDDAILILRGPEYLRREIEERVRQQNTPPPYSSGPPPSYSSRPPSSQGSHGHHHHRDDHSRGSLKVPVRAEHLTGFRERDIAEIMSRGFNLEDAMQILDEIDQQRPRHGNVHHNHHPMHHHHHTTHRSGAPPLPDRSTPIRRGSRTDMVEHSPIDQYQINPQFGSRITVPSRNSGHIMRNHSNDEESMLTESEISFVAPSSTPLENDALLMNLLLSQQKTKFGVNMYDALAPDDEPFIETYMKQGASLDQAVLRVFESRYGSVDAYHSSAEATQLNERSVTESGPINGSHYTRPAGMTPPSHYLHPTVESRAQRHLSNSVTPPPIPQQPQTVNRPELISYDIADNVEAEIELMMVSAGVSRELAVRMLLNKANKAKQTHVSSTPSPALSVNSERNQQDSATNDMSEERAIEVTLILSQQEADYGINMYDYIIQTPRLDPEVQQLIGQGYSRHDALLEVFRRNPPSKPPPKTSEELVRLQEEAELQAALRLSAHDNEMTPGVVSVPGSCNNSVASGGGRRESRGANSSANSVVSTGSARSGHSGRSGGGSRSYERHPHHHPYPQHYPPHSPAAQSYGPSHLHRSSSAVVNRAGYSPSAHSPASGGYDSRRGLLRRNSAGAPPAVGIADGSGAVREQDIGLVTAMGFSRNEAIEALLRHKDVNDAVDELLGHG